jgi:uncharacterized protein (DUF433 family)
LFLLNKWYFRDLSAWTRRAIACAVCYRAYGTAIKGLNRSTVKEAEQLVAGPTRAQKAELLQSIVRDPGDAFPGIENAPGVMGGAPCIARTRIPLWLLEQAFRLGTREAELLRNYPALTAQDLANA